MSAQQPIGLEGRRRELAAQTWRMQVEPVRTLVEHPTGIRPDLLQAYRALLGVDALLNYLERCRPYHGCVELEWFDLEPNEYGQHQLLSSVQPVAELDLEELQAAGAALGLGAPERWSKELWGDEPRLRAAVDKLARRYRRAVGDWPWVRV